MNYQKIQLLGGAEVHVDFDSQVVSCKKCGKAIRFGITKNNKKMPISLAYISNFTDCPAAADFRRNDSLSRIEETDRNQEYLNNL